MDDNNNFLNSYKNKTDARLAATPPGETAGTGEQNSAPASTVPSAAPEAARREPGRGFRPVPKVTVAAGPRRRNPVVPIAVAAVVVLAVVAGAIWFFNRGVKVIDLTNWTKADASLWASQNGIQLQLEEQYNDEYGEGKIFYQSVAAGQSVPKGSFLRLTASKGHDLTVAVELPDLKSMSKDQVDAWAQQNFMAKVRVTAEFSNDVEAGRVIRFEINDNTVVDNVTRNTPIYVIVSKGKEDAAAVLVTVPNFREKTIADSYTFATDNGITLDVVEQYDDYAPKGSILSQSVKATEKVSRGDTITLTVSKGKKITVPSFAGYTKTKATAVAGALSIPLSIVEKYSSKPLGEFISQSIPADSVYSDGDVLELNYSLGNKVVVSSFVGQTRDAIETWAKGLNDQGARITLSVTTTQSSQAKGKILFQDKADTSISISSTIRITVSAGRSVFVPDFVAPAGASYDAIMTRDKAMELCDSLGLVPVFVKASSAGRLPGEVFSQSIAAGTEVSDGTTITLKYVPADVQLTVPSFSGMTEAQIRSAGYANQYALTFVVGDTYVAGFEGKVVGQSVKANTRVAAGTAVTLTVGPKDDKLTVPNFSGKTETEIRAAGYDKQYMLTFVTGDTYVVGSEGKVIAQSVKADTRVAVGTELTLTVGPQPPAT